MKAAIFLVVLIVGLMLVGCGNKGVPTEDIPTSGEVSAGSEDAEIGEGLNELDEIDSIGEDVDFSEVENIE
jgi:hypothetical protein